MIELDGALGILLLFLWVYCILDVIATDPMLIRNLPKLAWLFIVILLPEVGSVVWLVLGRPKGAGFSPGSTSRARPVQIEPQTRMSGPVGPDDDPNFLKRADERRLREWEEDLKRRERRLRGEDEPQ